jgi:regulator of replication initiation timing
MDNLQGSLLAFKVKRQQEKKIEPIEEEVDVLVKMYAAIGPENETLKLEFSKRWERLSEAKRTELVERLLKDGLLPPIIKEALEIFSGKVVSLI